MFTGDGRMPGKPPRARPVHPPSRRRRRSAKSGEEMDFERRESVAVEYLCRLGEAREWMEACLGGGAMMARAAASEEDETEDDEDASVVVSAMSGGLVGFEEGLRNGVALARLASAFAPDLVPPERVFDADLRRYQEVGLSYRHTDNVNHFIRACKHLGLPEVEHK